MYNLKLTLAFLLMQSVNLSAGAVEIKVGDRPINLPMPEGFVELTPAMSPYYETMRAYIAPSNIRHLTLITQDNAEAIMQGEAVELNRYINVESQAAISGTSVSSGQFTSFRSTYRNQIVDAFSKVEDQMSMATDKGNAVISAEFSAELAVELGGMVPLPVHLELDYVIANSLYMTVGATADGEDIGTKVIAATSAVLHVKDKVLFTYTYGTESELEWTRNAAATWAAKIVAANPLSAEERRAVDKSDSPRFDWGQVLVAALAGGAIGLISFFVRKRKKT